MKKTSLLILGVVLFLMASVSAFALDVTGTAPTVSNGTTQIAINTAFDATLLDLQSKVGDIDPKPKEFIQSWGNAAVFASHGATTRAYGDYKLFTFSVGSMIGVQLPGNPFDLANDLGNLPEKLNQDKDIKLGVSPQIINARLGINASKILLKNLHLGVHFGAIKMNGDLLGLDGFNYDFLSLGVTANYQLIPQIKVVPFIVLWRGVNLGSGLIYQKTNINYAVGLDSISSTESNVTVQIDPKVTLDMNINTVTIPLEAITAVRLFGFLNIPLGVGVDLGFGKSSMKIGAKGDISVKDTSGYVTTTAPGNISISAGGDMAPNFFNLKLMTGLGFNFGPVLLDIPVTIYAKNGYNVGVTVGVVW